MKPKVVTRADEIEPLLARVCAIADKNRFAFGFLPQIAYVDLAIREQVWIAQTDANDLAGYVLFGTGKARIRIFQLYVDQAERGRGIGSTLVAEVKRLAGDRGYQTVSARVAADLPANQFWEEQGFRIIRQVPGGQTKNRLINERLFEVAGASLWSSTAAVKDAQLLTLALSQPVLSVANYAIDVNVLLDVTKNRDHAALVRDVISGAIRNEYRLCVTSELSKELERASSKVNVDPVLNLARGLPTLPSVPSQAVKTLHQELRSLLFTDPGRSPKRHLNDESDVMHLAMCIHHKVSGFITRDAAILRAAVLILEKYALEVLSPADLSSGESRRDDGIAALRASIEGSSFTVAVLDEAARGEAELFLDRHGLAKVSQTILDPGTDQSLRTRLIFRRDVGVAAIATWTPLSRHGRELHVFLIVDDQASHSERAVDHVLETAGNSVVGRDMVRIVLHTLPTQAATRETARKRGFELLRNTSDGLFISVRYAHGGVITEKNWSEFVQQLQAATGLEITTRCPTHSELANTGLLVKHRNNDYTKLISLFELETSLSPVLIIGKGRPAVMTPIREDYANDLISASTRQFTLFAKEAPTHLERAYFGRPGMERAFARGAIVVFYISGRRNEAVGLGRVTAAGRYSLSDAFQIFSRQGVLAHEEMQEISQDGYVGVFTFDAYRNLPKPIGFATLRAEGIANAANLVTSQQISRDQLLRIMSLSQGK